MTASSLGARRVLIVHPDEETRRTIEQTLRRVAEGPIATYDARSLTEGLASIRTLDPQVVLLDLTEQRGLALEVSRAARRADRLVIGLFNPLVGQGGELDFFREAVRAGMGDFVPLPVSDTEIEAVLRAAPNPSVETDRSGEGRVVGFFSHKGGVGTSTLAVNLALAVGQGTPGTSDVALCDAALHLGDASALLGLAPDRDLLGVVRDLGEISALPTYLSEHPGSGLRVLASPRDPVAAESVTPEALSRVLIELRQRFRTVVVDTGSTLDAMALAVLDLADVIYLVTDGSTPTVLGLTRALTLLETLGFQRDRLRIILNRHGAFDGSLPAATVAQQLGRAVDHVVPYDAAVLVAGNTGAPLVLSRPKSPFVRAMAAIAEGAGTD